MPELPLLVGSRAERPRPQASRVEIVRLGPETTQECLDLAVDRQWAADESRWRFQFARGEVWGTRADDGTLIGTATVLRFGDVVAIGNVLVAQRAERRGLGRALMEHVLREHDGAVFLLNATAFGRPLYERLGFEEAGSTHTYRGVFVPEGPEPADGGATMSHSGLRAATLADLSAIVRLDAEVYGANREPLLRLLLTELADQAWVSTRAGAITGFGARWRGLDSAQIGPLLAEDDADAAALIVALGRDAGGVLRVDLNGRDTALRAWMMRCGLAETGVSTLMVRGASAAPGDRTRWYSALMQAVG